MREIKFRAYSKTSKQIMMNVQNMYDSLGRWYDNHGNEIDCYDGFPVSSFGSILDDEDCIVMQFTGLKDKNGKEIYEGDILKCGQMIDAIEWKEHKDEAGWGLKDWSLQWFVVGASVSFSEIIGNIYENPELLTEKNK